MAGPGARGDRGFAAHDRSRYGQCRAAIGPTERKGLQVGILQFWRQVGADCLQPFLLVNRQVPAPIAEHGNVEAFLRGQLLLVDHRRRNEHTTVAKLMAIHGDLIGVHHDEKVGLARRHHGTQHAGTEPHITGNRATTLAHAVKFTLLDLETGPDRSLGDDVGSLDDALATETGNDDIGDVAAHLTTSFLLSVSQVCRVPARSYSLIFPAISRQGRRAIMTVSFSPARLSLSSAAKPFGSAEGSITWTLWMPSDRARSSYTTCPVA